MATLAQPFPRPVEASPRYEGLLAWLATTDHKKIGILYLATGVHSPGSTRSGGTPRCAVRSAPGWGPGCWCPT